MSDLEYLQLCVRRRMTAEELVEAKVRNDTSRNVEQVVYEWPFSAENRVTAHAAQRWTARTGADVYVKQSMVPAGAAPMNRRQRRNALRARKLL